MKKIAMFVIAAVMAVTATAQETTAIENKKVNNWYVGAQVGTATGLKGHRSFDKFDGRIGFRVGKNFNPVFSLVGEAMYKESLSVGSWGGGSQQTTSTMDINVLAAINLTNAFAGYRGEPRRFEVTALAGLGWRHNFCEYPINALTGKVALNFAYNFGNKKQWQVYFEPALVYSLQKWGGYMGQHNQPNIKFNIHDAELQLSVGVNYKLGNSKIRK